jgi:hypothetical protein
MAVRHLHPLRGMLRLDTNEERIAGVLHDVVEDCGWTIATVAVTQLPVPPRLVNALHVKQRPLNSRPSILRGAGYHPEVR